MRRAGEAVWTGGCAQVAGARAPRAARVLACAFVLAALTAACLLACPSPAHASNSVSTGQLPDGSFIYEVEIADLTADETYYDNQSVQVTGEVVGDRIREENGSDYCWITLTALHGEDSASVQVLVTNAQADAIDSYGRYGVTGSKVRVMGTFHANCSAHEGLEDIHVTSLTVVDQGSSSQDAFDPSDLLASSLLVVLGVLLFLGYRQYRARSR